MKTALTIVLAGLATAVAMAQEPATAKATDANAVVAKATDAKATDAAAVVASKKAPKPVIQKPSGSLATALAGISKAIADPDILGATIRKLSPADQVKYIAAVNAAIAKMPGSNETRTGYFIAANRAALQNAAPKNTLPILAEMFATVPPESLAVLNEVFAAELFNREADPRVTYTDAQYDAIATEAITKIVARCEPVEEAGVRETFAIMLFLRASNYLPESEQMSGLTDVLVSKIDPKSQELAKKEWLPAAMAQSESTKSYAPILGATDFDGEQVDKEKALEVSLTLADIVTLRTASSQLLDSMLGTLVEGTPLINTELHKYAATVPMRLNDAGGVDNAIVNPEEPGGRTGGDEHHDDPQDEPGGYRGRGSIDN